MKILLIAKYSLVLLSTNFLWGYLGTIYFFRYYSLKDPEYSVFMQAQMLVSLFITFTIFTIFAKNNQKNAHLIGVCIYCVSSLIGIVGIYSVNGTFMFESLLFETILSLLTMSAGVSFGLYLGRKGREAREIRAE